MKKFLIILLTLIIGLNAYAENLNIVCPNGGYDYNEKENPFNIYTGINLLSSKLIQTIIQNELSKELNSEITAQIEIFNVKRIKEGEFKKLTLKSNNLRYKLISLTDFYAQTICPYNKVIYKNKKLYYPYDLTFKYNAKITNQDITNIINSKEFQNKLKKLPISLNGINIFEIKSVNSELRDNKIHFIINIKTLLGSIKIKFSSDIEVENNKIVLKDITCHTKSNIISDTAPEILNKINPISYQTDAINGKYCKINITEAKIKGDTIVLNGLFIINRNLKNE